MSSWVLERYNLELCKQCYQNGNTAYPTVCIKCTDGTSSSCQLFGTPALLCKYQAMYPTELCPRVTTPPPSCTPSKPCNNPSCPAHPPGSYPNPYTNPWANQSPYINPWTNPATCPNPYNSWTNPYNSWSTPQSFPSNSATYPANPFNSYNPWNSMSYNNPMMMSGYNPMGSYLPVNSMPNLYSMLYPRTNGYWKNDKKSGLNEHGK